ncbi:hypothetical protein VA7868_03610 [Vibrio aerogenes CECT 7868]|uniref:Outer membrane protein beta-barrel domain-containing protein n=1 Tax=Vibrio aerogenes CECT 7868 TaxID=1216006 RepID=A0A1M6AM35_9VIBR|nr:hypothetical protein [Vibrio aerogenes]SHI37477.1 hypothetical protein VA7868_03610 [Vibrio aerogenes CECT 7868]
MRNQWWLMLLGMCSLSGHAIAETTPPGTFYFGVLQEELNQSGVIEIGVRGPAYRFVDANAALMWFGDNDTVYNGFNIGAHLTTGTWPIKAYAGAGIFLGEHKDCEDESSPDCESDYVLGAYPEVGVELSLLQVSVAAYGRHYKTTNGGKNEYRMYGFYVGYNF